MQLKANQLELSMAKYDRSHTEKKHQTIDNVFHHYQLSINNYLNNNCFFGGVFSSLQQDRLDSVSLSVCYVVGSVDF